MNGSNMKAHVIDEERKINPTMLFLEDIIQDAVSVTGSWAIALLILIFMCIGFIPLVYLLMKLDNWLITTQKKT